MSLFSKGQERKHLKIFRSLPAGVKFAYCAWQLYRSSRCRVTARTNSSSRNFTPGGFGFIPRHFSSDRKSRSMAQFFRALLKEDATLHATTSRVLKNRPNRSGR